MSILNNLTTNKEDNLVVLSSVRPRNIQAFSRSDTNQSNVSNTTTKRSKKAELWNKVKTSMVKYSSFIGPGLMVSVAYMDPGNYATGITAGASNKYSLLFIIFVSNLIAIFLQTLCIKLGSVTGYDLARCCREYLPHKLNILLWILAECAIIATDVAEVIGSAIALNILLKIPLPAGVAITVVDVLFVLMAYRNDTSSTRFVKIFEYAVALMVVVVAVCFAVELAQIPSDANTVREIFRGYVPSQEMFSGSGVSISTSLIGATVMIHSLFLGSGIVQPRLREYDVQNGHVVLDDLIDAEDELIMNEKSETKQRHFKEDKEALYFYNSYKPSYQAIQYSYKYSVIELIVSLFTFAFFVNLAILIIAGSTLYETPEAKNADLYAIHKLLSTNLAPAVGTVFMLALLFSGQSSGIVCTIAGQIVSEGHINWTVKPWLRRLLTRSIAIVPCLIISISIGKNGLNEALNISQVVISLLLPPLTAPLIYFTCKKSIMKVELPTNLQPQESSHQPETDQPQDPAHESDPEQDSKKYKYMNNNWLTTITLVVIWLFVSVLNIYAIVDIARNGVAGA